MVEIEIRAKIKNLEKIKRNLISSGGKFIKKEEQIDKIFGRSKDLDANHKIIEGRFSARVRQKENKVLVELKEIRRSGSGLEFSSPISKIEDGVYLLATLDFKEAFTISKTRETYQINDFEISLDQVEKLGDFVEIEHCDKTGNNKKKGLRGCRDLLIKLDSTAKIEPKKYGDLMQELINNSK